MENRPLLSNTYQSSASLNLSSPDEFNAPLANPNPLPREAKSRVLVVDDAPDITQMISVMLKYAGYDVATAFSAPDALELAQAEQFDIVVSDIGMPGMSGYELAKELRSLEAYKDALMIAITGFSMYEDRERALFSGFNEFLTKPINPMALIDMIKRSIN